VARYLDRKLGRKYMFGGYDVNIDATARGQTKTVFDGNVVSNFDAFEMLLDYTFVRLGLPGGSDGGLGHPLVMTETVCNPTYSRKCKSTICGSGMETRLTRISGHGAGFRGVQRT
jgi:actin-related protein 5